MSDYRDLNYDGCVYLAAGILEQANTDFKKCARKIKELERGMYTEEEKKEIKALKCKMTAIKRFYLSDFGQLLSNGNGQKIIERLEGDINRQNKK